MTSCYVPLCEVKKNDASHTLHKIPAGIALRLQWFNAIGISLNKIKQKKILVCSAHFKKGDFIRHPKGDSKRRRLRKDAVPSLNLTKKFYKTKNITDQKLTIVSEKDQCLAESCQSSDLDLMGPTCSKLIGTMPTKSKESADYYQSENSKKDHASADHPHVDEYQAWCEGATAVLRKMDAARARKVMTLFSKHLSLPRHHGRNHANGYIIEAEGSGITAKELKDENIGQKRSFFARSPVSRFSEPVCNNFYFEADEALDIEAKQQIEQINLLKMEIELLQIEHDARMAMYDKQFPCPSETLSTIETKNDDAPTGDHV